MNQIQKQPTKPNMVNTNDMALIRQAVKEIQIDSTPKVIIELEGGYLIPTSPAQVQTYIDELRRESEFRSRAVLNEANAIIRKLRRIYSEVTDPTTGTPAELPEPVLPAGYRLLRPEEQLEQEDQFSADGINWVGTHFSGQTVHLFEVGRYRRQIKVEVVDSKSDSEIPPQLREKK